MIRKRPGFANFYSFLFLLLVLSSGIIGCASVHHVSSLEKMDLTPTQRIVLTTAYNQLGKRYKAGGTSPKGFDCSGLVFYSFSKAKMEMARTSSSLATMGYSVNKSDALPGDLLIFADKGRIHHVGIVYENRRGKLSMIHSSSSKGVIIEDVLGSSYWKPRLIDVRRIID